MLRARCIAETTAHPLKRGIVVSSQSQFSVEDAVSKRSALPSRVQGRPLASILEIFPDPIQKVKRLPPPKTFAIFAPFCAKKGPSSQLPNRPRAKKVDSRRLLQDE
jgi:hypothetical protein